MTFKPIVLFLCCFIICVESYAKHKKASDNVLYVVDYIPMIVPNDFNFRLSGGEFYISNDDIYSKEIISDKKKIVSVGYDDIDTLIVIITKGYHNRPDDVKRIPSFYNIAINKKDAKLYLKDSKEPYTGDFINYYFFGKMYSKGKIINGLFNDTLTLFYEDGVTKKSSSVFKNGKLNGSFSQYFANGSLKLTGTYNDSIKSGYWIEWYSTGVIKRRLFYDNGKLMLAKEDKEWTGLMEKADKFRGDGKYNEAIMCYENAIQLRPDISDIYYLKGKLEDRMDRFNDAIHDLNKAIKLEPYYNEAIAERIAARIQRLESAGSTKWLRMNEDTTPEEEREKVCNDLKKIAQGHIKDRYIGLNLSLPLNTELEVMHAINEIKNNCQ